MWARDSLFGYDQGVMGGLLTLPSFLKTFPEIDIAAAPAARQSHVSTIQGRSAHTSIKPTDADHVTRNLNRFV